MNLRKLLEPLITYKVVGEINIDINDIKVDSRKVEHGNLFICLPGSSSDGHDYAKQSVENGAVALICENELPINIPQVIVKNSRFAMALLTDKFYNHPSHKLKVIGITGTNGKTTTTYLIEKILADQNHLSGLIGTIRMKIGNEIINVKNTTPDANDLHNYFNKMVEVGSEYAILEVSSHALDMGRVKGVDFNIAVFTNLTQDHLDYHGTMDKYREAKGLLFSRLGNVYFNNSNSKFAVLNADDDASQYFNKITAVQVITYGIDNDADVKATNINITGQGTSFTLISFKGKIDINLKMIGKFSVYNALGAIAVALIEGIALENIKHSLEEISGVDGRFELVNANQDYTVIVDYAHTPDGLENVLKTIKEFAKRKVYCVFGAGGDRDKSKRPLMGKIALNYSDLAIITSDNPRTEDPEQIIKDILEGIITEENRSKYITIQDRKKAIEYAVNNARSGDVIIIAGKGHENYQILNDKVIHFDDREVALEAIRSKL
ncbi:MAG: UDP-N-acetylmuramoyl-L-alanyl-D-glutamate--2,6-diaminopimelate ligase [Vulcanibacillus sp.]